jgi:hypothetical protein
VVTKASGADSHEAVLGLALRHDEPAPVHVLADSAYGTGDARAALAGAGHTAVIKPIPLRAPVPGGFTTDDVDVDRGTVTCPAGHTVSIRPSRGAAFERFCHTCPLAARCTTATRGRKLTIHHHERLLRAARRQAQTTDFNDVYRQHQPMVERSIACATAAQPRTTTGCTTEPPPPSTCAGYSRSASAPTTPGGYSPDPPTPGNRAQATEPIPYQHRSLEAPRPKNTTNSAVS